MVIMMMIFGDPEMEGEFEHLQIKTKHKEEQ
jgi:hypothetical protein